MTKKLIAKTPQAENRKSTGSKINAAENHRRSRRSWAAHSVLLAALAISKPSASFAEQANILVNGDFEEPALQCGFWLPVPAGSGFITGWNVNIPSVNMFNGGCNGFPNYSDSVDLLAAGPFVHTGLQSIDMAGTFSTPGDSLFQDVPTTPGRTYTLTFYTSSNGSAKQNGLTVEWDDVPLATISTPDQGIWTVNTFTVRASFELSRLRFVDNLGGAQGSLLDTVSLVASADTEPPVVSCPPSVTVAVGSIPPAATNVAQFTAQGGSISDNQDPNPSVVSSDEVSGSCPIMVTRTYTVTDASGNATQCQQSITVQNLFADDGIVWYRPLARSLPAAAGTHPNAKATRLHVFKLGSTIPVKVRVQGCDGTDLTGNDNVIGMLQVFPVGGSQNDSTGGALPIDFNGLGGPDGLMVKSGGFLKYNLDTKTLPSDTQSFLLQVTVFDTATGESFSESLAIQAR